MENFYVVSAQTVTMYIMIAVGAFCYKVKIINTEVNKRMTDLLLQVINPIVIIMAYQVDLTQSRIFGLGLAFIASILVNFLGILIAHLLIGKEKTDHIVERYACVFSNSVFMGLPLIQGLYGEEGVFYLTAFVAVSNLFMWTYGVSVMKGVMSGKEIVNVIKNPSILAIFFGLALFLLNIKLPTILGNACSSLAGMNTPLAMLVAGASIIQTNLWKAVCKKRIWYIILIKMILIPIASMSLFLIPVFGEYSMVTMVIVVLMACPTATHAALMSLKYDRNYLYATEIFAITTVISSITLPIVSLAGSLFS